MSKQLKVLVKRFSGAVLVASVLVTGSVQAQEWVSLAKTQPAELFNEKCGMCHRPGGMGVGILARRMSAELALLENRRDLQPALISTVVRSGFGVMCPSSRAEVSDPQLQTIIKYLTKENR